MSRPLELIVYEIDRTEPSMVVVDGFWEYRPYDPAKRLTDAELAAEYWKVLGGLYDGHGKAARERRDTLHRFANHPHYDEADR